MNRRMRGIWDMVLEKETLEAAGRAICAEETYSPLIKLWVSAACGLALALAPLVGAAEYIVR